MTVEQKAHPDFFIIGAPKSGTTALSEYLRQHPDVLFSQPKEPHFFNDDFSHRYTETLEEYLDCFSHGSGEEKAVGEGSVFYLYSKTAVSNILKRNPNARFIVMLRNPVEAAYSWHWQSVYSFGEHIDDFEAAWRAQEPRQRGENLPLYNRVSEALHYGPLFSYSTQLKRLFEQVAREQVLVILYDDFKSQPDAVYDQALKFLSLPPHQLEKYDRINASKQLRWSWVARAVNAIGALKRSMGINKGIGVLTRLKRWNTSYRERPSLSPKFRAELEEYFREDVIRTADLIDRDLSGWLNE